MSKASDSWITPVIFSLSLASAIRTNSIAMSALQCWHNALSASFPHPRHLYTMVVTKSSWFESFHWSRLLWFHWDGHCNTTLGRRRKAVNLWLAWSLDDCWHPSSEKACSPLSKCNSACHFAAACIPRIWSRSPRHLAVSRDRHDVTIQVAWRDDRGENDETTVPACRHL